MNKAADGIKVIPRSKVSKKYSQAGMLAGSGAEIKAFTCLWQDPASRDREPCPSLQLRVSPHHPRRPEVNILLMFLTSLWDLCGPCHSLCMWMLYSLEGPSVHSTSLHQPIPLLAHSSPRYQFTHYLLSLKHNLSPPSRSIHLLLATKTSLLSLSLSGSSPYYHLRLVFVTSR